MFRMGWNYWVLNSFSGSEPPGEWVKILGHLSSLIPDKYIRKIEVAAFSIRGERTARWLVDSSHPEYSDKEDSLGAAKKLTWLMLESKGGPSLTKELHKLLTCSKNNQCKLLEGHEGECKEKFEISTSKCPLCQETLRFKDFKKDARSELFAIQMGHLSPLSKCQGGHNSDNVFWMHRRCNYIQDEQNIEKTVEDLCEIVRKHGYEVSSTSEE